MELFLYKYSKSRITLNAVVLYPNSYSIGMSSLAFQNIYHLLQLYPFIHCERAFIGADANSRVKTFESGRGIELFDVIFVTISYEPDILNFVNMLKSSGIEVLSKKRQNPLIIAGGIATSFLYYYLKDIADITVCAPADYAFPIIIDKLGVFKNRDELMDNLKDYEAFHTRNNENGNNIKYHQYSSSLVQSVIISDRAEFSRMGLIEISRGCLYNCNFCLISKIYGNYFYYPEDSILMAAEKYNGLTKKIGLIAATLTNHPSFKDIVKELNRLKFRLSFSAFRIEGLDDELLELILKNENKTLTIAPETASVNLKQTINKVIPNDKIIEKASIAFKMGLKRLKLYFMVGLPGEKAKDLEEIISLVKNLRQISHIYSKLHNYNPEFIININPLVPKPFTLFEDLPMEETSSIKKKIIMLKRGLREIGRTYVYGESPKTALLQYRLSRHIIPLKDIIANLKSH
jgi:radical SAM superfamily enzyme YgiQ (UPF0313 family)